MKKISVLVKKEVLEILRDKKTLIIMVLVPILLYPAIIFGMSTVMSMIMQSQSEKTHTVWYEAQDQEFIEVFEDIYHKNQEELDFEIAFVCVPDQKLEGESGVQLDFLEEGETIQVRAEYNSANQDSRYTEDAIQELSELYREQLLSQNLEKAGLSENFLHPLSYEAVDGSTASETVGVSIGGSMGMLLITMILMGAFYPAVDITTGEKERGTLETLLTLPVTNFQMIMSKYIAVSMFSCITAVISLISLGGVVGLMMTSLPEDAMGGMEQIAFGVYLSYIPVLLLVMITTSMLITALSMCFCMFAKSTKEANNYITPVMLVVMFASMIGMIPTVELDYKLVLIPLVNVSLLIKQVFSQQMDLVLTGMTIFVNMGYGVILIGILAKMYDSEDILFSDGFRSFRIFQKRSEIQKGTIPAVGDILMCLVVVLLAMIYVSSIVRIFHFFGSLVATQLLICIVPILVVWYMKSDVKSLFCLNRPRVSAALGSILFYIGIYSIMLVVSTLLSAVFQESAQNVEETFAEIMEQPFVLLVLVIAVMPAVGEELLFRGLTFGSLRANYSTKWAVCVSALIFGVFHMSIVKLIPTAMLGACFAIVVSKSGSIFLSMLLHFINNLLSVVAMKYPEKIEKIFPVLAKSEFSGIDFICLLLVGVVSAGAGYLVLKKSTINQKL